MAYEVKWENPGKARTLDVASVVRLESAIAADGTSLAELMDRAGASVAAFVRSQWETGSHVLVFCGKGNNGGDGWVTARLLAEAGYKVRVVSPCPAGDISAHPAHEAALDCMTLVHGTGSLGLSVLPDADELASALANSDVVVDAMLGTGFHFGSLHEPTAGWVAAIGASRGRREAPAIVAVDTPSGLNAQTGEATEPAVRADFTVTMMSLKPGLVTKLGKDLCGEIRVARIAPIERYL